MCLESGSLLIRHIDQFWRGWGQDVRRSPPAWPTKNTLYRAGYLTGGVSFGPRIPRVEYSTQDYYRAQDIWQRMPDDLRSLTYFLYALPWHPGPVPVWKRQRKKLGVSKSEYYRQIHDLHLYTEERL